MLEYDVIFLPQNAARCVFFVIFVMWLDGWLEKICCIYVVIAAEWQTVFLTISSCITGIVIVMILLLPLLLTFWFILLIVWYNQFSATLDTDGWTSGSKSILLKILATSFHFVKSNLTRSRSEKYSVSQKKSPLKISGIFSQTVGNFLTKFYVPVIRSYLRWITNFYLMICNFDKVMPYYARPPSSHHTRKTSTIGWNARWHFLTFFQNSSEFLV